jgi:uncharacterized protein (DUF924 family)
MIRIQTGMMVPCRNTGLDELARQCFRSTPGLYEDETLATRR